jgi:hypothetical protein
MMQNLDVESTRLRQASRAIAGADERQAKDKRAFASCDRGDFQAGSTLDGFPECIVPYPAAFRSIDECNLSTAPEKMNLTAV